MMLWFLLIIQILTIIAFGIYIYHQKKYSLTGKAAEEVAKLIEEIEKAAARVVDEIEKKTETLSELTASAEDKAMRLEALTRQNRIEKLKPSKSSQPVVNKDLISDEKKQVIFEMKNKGLSVTEIARKTGMGTGEIELYLGLQLPKK